LHYHDNKMFSSYLLKKIFNNNDEVLSHIFSKLNPLNETNCFLSNSSKFIILSYDIELFIILYQVIYW